MTKSLCDRMKENYENRSRFKLTRRTPVILRLDGKSFHTFTKDCERPFDEKLSKAMIETAKYVCYNIQGAKIAYVQSDEISILITDFDNLQTDAWFDYNVQKMCSVASGYASAFFTDWYRKLAVFDCRVFNIPKEEVCNYFIWRQKDWIRNSMQMLALANFSHKQLLNKSFSKLDEMLFKKNVCWDKLPEKWKNGSTIIKADFWFSNPDIIFSKQRELIDYKLI